MRKYFIIIVLGFLVSGCMASFPAKYEPKYSMNPQLGKAQRVYATAKFENASGREMRGESLKLQLLVDKKIEDWGFIKDRAGRNLDITIKNVLKASHSNLAIMTGIISGLTLCIIPGIAIDQYQMTVVINEDNEEMKEPIIHVYNGSMMTYQEIFLIIWGIIAYPPKNAIYTMIENMLDHLMNDLVEEHKNQ